MGLRRLVKVKMGFKSGRLSIVRIVQANDSELILSNGMSIKILDDWRKHLSFWSNAETGKYTMTNRSSAGLRLTRY